MANRRIKDLDERTTLSSGDYFATDNTNGTRRVEVTKITDPINQVTQKVSNASDAYSATKAYKVGDIVIQNNTLYVCSTACSAASWAVNQNNFTATTVASELGDLNSALNNNHEWHEFTNATGSVEKTGDVGNYTEFYVMAVVGGTALVVSMVIPVAILDSQREMMGGFGGQYHAMIQVRAKITNGVASFQIFNCIIESNDVTSTTNWRVLAR